MDDKKKIEEALSESEIQEKKLRAAKAARKRKKRIKGKRGRNRRAGLWRREVRERQGRGNVIARGRRCPPSRKESSPNFELGEGIRE